MAEKAEAVGFLGLGAMGEPMAANLLASGFEVSVYNRTREKAQSLVSKGAKLAQTPADAVRPGGVVISILFDDASVAQIATGPDGILDRLGEGGVHVNMTTVGPATSRRLAALHQARGSAYVAAPVFGRPDAAAARKLWICSSGPKAAKERVAPFFAALGQGVFDFGEDAGASNAVKLAGNFMICSAIEALGEAVAMLEKNGVDASEAVAMFTKTMFSCVVYQGYGRLIAQRLFSPPGARLKLGLKDVDLILQTAAEGQAPMPFASLVRNRLLSAIAKGQGDLDWAALSLGALGDAGIKWEAK